MNIREVARKARVSHSTVSRIINNVQSVDPRLARRVNAVIEKYGYRPNYQARALARGRSHTVGLIVSELSGGNPFFAEIILYFERAAVENGYEVLVSFADTETRPEHVQACVDRMRERQVEGMALFTFGLEGSLRSGQGDIPMVYTGAPHDIPGVRNIRINYLTGMREAVKHLADFGHKRIGYLCGRLIWSTMRARLDAFRKAMKSAGLDFEKDLILECDHTWDGGALGMANFLNLPKPPSAVLCCNDVAAIGALKTLDSKGLQAGKDMAVIGLDDLTICRYTQPALSTIRFSPSELAAIAFQDLLGQIQGQKSGPSPEYKTRFVLRDSTCAPPREPR